MADRRRELLERSRSTEIGQGFNLTTALITQDFAPPQADPNAIIPTEGGYRYKRFQFTPVGLIIPDDVSIEELTDVGDQIGQLHSSMQWVIGDYLDRCDREWGDGTYNYFADRFGYEPSTLRQWAYVCRNVHLSIRIDKLSFGHHQLVAKFAQESQREWLNYAAENKLSVSGLRQALKSRQPAQLLSSVVQFERAVLPLKKRIAAIIKQAAPSERQQMATWLRQMATEIEQTE